MTDIELLPLPRTLQHADDADLAAHVQDYARACVAHATAAKDAEIEALRAKMAGLKSRLEDVGKVTGREIERAERLAEALQKLAAHVRPTCPVLWDEAQSALRDHDQEVGNG